jgi:hypothetical protein
MTCAAITEWRANRINDPIARLRYLRGARIGLRGWRFDRNWRLVCLAALLLIPPVPVRDAMAPRPPRAAAALRISLEPPAVWLLEQAADHESFSNGLRIDDRYLIETHRRSYPVYRRDRPESLAVEWRTDPAGIVYHATENHLAPFAPAESLRQQRIDEALLDYVRRRQSYHFVIDRFGRVYRVVAEGDVASHAGNSIWADQHWLYLNLNSGFLGVAFESRGDAEALLEAAQIQAGRMLTDMLRSRYQLNPDDCVTHAQVSVNPENMQIGYHTDWARDFPFDAMGLGDNYELPVPSIGLFGFSYSQAFLDQSGGRPWPGLIRAETAIHEEAAAWGLRPNEYARLLQAKYRRRLAALGLRGALEGTQS